MNNVLSILRRRAAPKVDPKDTTALAGALVGAWYRRETVSFALQGEELASDSLADPQGILPLVMWYANEMYRTHVDRGGLDVEFSQSSGARLGFTASFLNSHRAASEALLFILHAAEDFKNHTPVNAQGQRVLDGLVDTFISEQATLTSLVAKPMTQKV